MKTIAFVSLILMIVTGCSSGEPGPMVRHLQDLGFTENQAKQISAQVHLIEQNAPSSQNPATAERDQVITQAGIALLEYGNRIVPFLEERYRKASETKNSEGIETIYSALLEISREHTTAQALLQAPAQSLVDDICTVTRPDYDPKERVPIYKAGAAAKAFAQKGPDGIDALVDRILKVEKPPFSKALGIMDGLGEGPAIVISIVAEKWPNSPAPSNGIKRLVDFLLSSDNKNEYRNEYILIVLKNLTNRYSDIGAYTPREKNHPLSTVLLNSARRFVSEGEAQMNYDRSPIGYKMHSWGLDIMRKFDPNEAARLRESQR
jgi:hypothetical protein